MAFRLAHITTPYYAIVTTSLFIIIIIYLRYNIIDYAAITHAIDISYIARPFRQSRHIIIIFHYACHCHCHLVIAATFIGHIGCRYITLMPITHCLRLLYAYDADITTLNTLLYIIYLLCHTLFHYAIIIITISVLYAISPLASAITIVIRLPLILISLSHHYTLLHYYQLAHMPLALISSLLRLLLRITSFHAHACY